MASVLHRNRLTALLIVVVCAVMRVSGAPQDHVHPHTPAVSGVPQGIPFFCTSPTVTTAASGAWSNPATWSTRKVPGEGDRVSIAPGNDILYDATSDATLDCIDVRGRLRFATDLKTRLKVVTVMVFDEGALEIGSVAAPVNPTVVAEVIVADRRFDTAVDPSQIGHGIVALGKVDMHGAVKNPTFVRVAREPLAGHTSLVLERPVAGWQVGDELVLPDTRQLQRGERGEEYLPRDERVRIAAVSGSDVTLTAPLKYDHKGARTPQGALEFLPHVGNVSRNVVVRSENPVGTRGHTFFTSHAAIDIRYAEFRELGRTRAGVLDNTELDASGRPVRIGTNQIGRYPIHFHHNFGPKTTPANGYQFTLVGNAVVSTPKWGVTVHNSSYGLIQDQVVYNSRGAGIVTEDGSESFNVFDHNFSLRSEGSGAFAPRSGYGGVVPDPGGEGGGFWFRGQNNIIRNNVSANGDAYGYGMAAGALGVVQIPRFKGADTSKAAESTPLDTTKAPILEFANNEAYGTMLTGMACGWSGTITDFTVWHPSRHGLTGTPTDTLTVEKLTVRGDLDALARGTESSVGIWLGDYRAKDVVVKSADVQGMRTGVSSPFVTGNQSEPGSGSGSLTVEQSTLQTQIGVAVGTAYTSSRTGDKPAKRAVVRGLRFEPLRGANGPSPEAISMNDGMAPGDSQPREPIQVFDFNGKSDDHFTLYYSNQAPPSVAPCHDARPGVGGWVCR